ncbi:MAG: 3-phosphoshikimate 1-carboxyvinyltransferase [Gemmatimonadota bacterium]
MTIELRVPGDKSITHRALILSCLAGGTSHLRGLPDSLDVQATMGALRGLGAKIIAGPGGGTEVRGPVGWEDARRRLDCANSGTSARLLTGLIAGVGVEAEVDGDASLRRRPMDRVVYPLQAMGARIRYLERPDALPIRIERRSSGALRPLRHRTRVASAQVKSSLLLAGLASRTRVEVVEPYRSRDHTERLLLHLGAPVRFGAEESGEGAGTGSSGSAPPGGDVPGSGRAAWRVVLEPDGWSGRLRPFTLEVPGDPSSAAFLIAASLLGGEETRIREVALNPTRVAFLDVLEEMGAAIEVRRTGEECGEPVGELWACPSDLGPLDISASRIPWLLDEIPVLAVLASRARGTSVVRGASELRVKESDRLALLASNLSALGVVCRELPDGLEIEGTNRALRGEVRTGGDHRLAMAFGVLARRPDCLIRIDDVGCVTVSYPGFWEDLDRVFPPRTA